MSATFVQALMLMAAALTAHFGKEACNIRYAAMIDFHCFGTRRQTRRYSRVRFPVIRFPCGTYGSVQGSRRPLVDESYQLRGSRLCVSVARSSGKHGG
jgi:hypothetical protein